MKAKYLALGLCVLATPILRAASDCELPILVAPIEQGENVPAQTEDYLMTRLMNVATESGLTADTNYGQFFIGGKFNHLYQDVVPGPPTQTALHTTLTVYIGDISTKKIFASKSFELRGVGTSEQRAFINAMKGLNARNKDLESLISNAKKEILTYFNNNYKSIIAEGSRSASIGDYERALWELTSIPTCCNGYDNAEKEIIRVYKQYINKAGSKLLQQAKAAWAAGHTVASAEQAMEYLSMIDPESNAFSSAESLIKEISSAVKSDRDFELRQKHNDAVGIQHALIEGARAVGVAYGKGQQPVTTHINWIRR